MTAHQVNGNHYQPTLQRKELTRRLVANEQRQESLECAFIEDVLPFCQQQARNLEGAYRMIEYLSSRLTAQQQRECQEYMRAAGFEVELPGGAEGGRIIVPGR